MTFKQLVKVVEAAAVAAALIFVIMLFASKSDGGGGTTSVGAKLYTSTCAGCHGADGGGALGPKLAGVVTKDFPDIEDQIAFVARGKGTMPAFADDLSEEELRAVVEYTRSELGG